MAETDKKAFAELMSYKDAVMKRSEALLKSADAQDIKISGFASMVDASRNDLRKQVSELKDELIDVKKQVSEAKITILQSIGQMRYSVKKDEPARIEKRSEAWNPEMLAQRKDLKKFI